LISRLSTVLVLIVCMGIAWALVDRNVALIIMIGTGGMMAAFAGPLVMGAVWHGVTRAGAYAGLISGMTAFILFHMGWIDPVWFEGTPLFGVAEWLSLESPNPYSCAALGEIVSVVVTFVVSKITTPLPQAHLDALFNAD